MKVEVLPFAQREIEEARDWYKERSPRSALTFLREVERGIRLIGEVPSIWPVFVDGTRRYILRRFPYDLIFRESTNRVVLIAVAHHKRKPHYWIGRGKADR